MTRRKERNLAWGIKTIFEKTYHGFEEIYDLERDISELFCYGDRVQTPAEFMGKIHVMIGYESDDILEED